MKVLQVTYCGGNYGSVLQCYATQTAFKANGAECVLVARSEKGISRVLQTLEFRANMIGKMLRFPGYARVAKQQTQALNDHRAKKGMCDEARQAVDRFIDQRINRKCYSWKELKRIAGSDTCDFCISGSDQIWSADWFVTNRIWFLRFCPQEKRVAWMPSFGAEQLAVYNRADYAKYISQYARLSVREEVGAKIIKDLIGISVPVLADPVFMLQANEWRNLAVGETRVKPYILMFFLHQPSALAMHQLEQIKNTIDCDLVYFSYDHHDPNGEFVYGGPEQFLWMLDHAAVVLTDSFHACAFSAILHTPFYVFDRSDACGARQMSRVVSLLDTLRMQERYIQSAEDYVSTALPASWEKVDEKLACIREGINGYLESILRDYNRKES